MSFTLLTAKKNTMLNSLAVSYNSGYLTIYDGLVPANANSALGSNNVLVSLPFSATAFPAAVGGVLTANTITQTNATGTGTATFYRALESDGVTVISQGTVGVSGAELNLNTTSIVAAGPVAITSYTISI